eukprot:TRINITY_DN45770_c0_g1_i1.p1 TRINITY_DN45770_c0_g1~~TRINITY_DN45770_c0_g1_i1.p1  ORF type:complete len:582 (-),score=83.62 TRINITY_DN45770_c0_g1_i1:8-1516(-)
MGDAATESSADIELTPSSSAWPEPRWPLPLHGRRRLRRHLWKLHRKRPRRSKTLKAVDPKCHDIEDTGLPLQCAAIGKHCRQGNSAAAIQALCPATCNITCAERPCRDVSFTTFQEEDGSMSLCHHLKGQCQHRGVGERVRRVCPSTCGECAGAPLTILPEPEAVLLRLVSNGTQALELALTQLVILRPVVQTDALGPAWRISRILHQTWKTDAVPAKYANEIASWRRLHPAAQGWHFEFWDDHRGQELVREHFPQYEDQFSKMSGIKRADVARLVALFAHGGIYADVDVEAVRSFDALLRAAEVARQGVLLGEENEVHTVLLEKRLSARLVSNAVMASAPRHPFWLEVLDEIFSSKACGSDPVLCTGPRLIDRLSLEHIRQQPACGSHGCLARLPFEYFSPNLARWNAGNMAQSCRELAAEPSSLEVAHAGALLGACGRLEKAIAYPAAMQTPRTFAVHHWQCSWCREDEALQRTVPLREVLWRVGNETYCAWGVQGHCDR